MFQTHPQINNISLALWILHQVVYASHVFTHSKHPNLSFVHNVTFLSDILCTPFVLSNEPSNHHLLFRRTESQYRPAYSERIRTQLEHLLLRSRRTIFTPYMRVLVWEHNQMQRYRNQRSASDYQCVSFARERYSSILFCTKSRAVWGNVCLFLDSISTVSKGCSY